MPTRSEYREYIASPEWQARRKEFLYFYPACNRCGLPRWLAIIAYDQDLHVHHRSYARIGCELESDLEPLCRRCHEIETFGKSTLHEVRKHQCVHCGDDTWDSERRACDFCRVLNPKETFGLVERRKWNQIVSAEGETLACFVETSILPLVQQKSGAK
jgi:hypothetical protein